MQNINNEKMRLRIAESVAKYNSTHSNRLTMSQLADRVIQDRPNKPRELEIKRKRWLISRWNNGQKWGMLTPEIIVGICEVTGVSPNYLLGWRNQVK